MTKMSRTQYEIGFGPLICNVYLDYSDMQSDRKIEVQLMQQQQQCILIVDSFCVIEFQWTHVSMDSFYLT